jgi:hypothetical protein
VLSADRRDFQSLRRIDQPGCEKRLIRPARDPISAVLENRSWRAGFKKIEKNLNGARSAFRASGKHARFPALPECRYAQHCTGRLERPLRVPEALLSVVKTALRTWFLRPPPTAFAL